MSSSSNLTTTQSAESKDSSENAKQHFQMIASDVNYFIDHMDKYISFRSNQIPLVRESLDGKIGTYCKLMSELHESFEWLKKLQPFQDEKKIKTVVTTPTTVKFTLGTALPKDDDSDLPKFFTHNGRKYAIGSSIDYDFKMPIIVWFEFDIQLSYLKESGHELGIMDRISNDPSYCHVLIGYSFSVDDISRMGVLLESKNILFGKMSNNHDSVHFSGSDLESTPFKPPVWNYHAHVDIIKSENGYIFNAIRYEG